MDIFEAMKKRHSVRSYTTEKIDSKLAKELQEYIDQCNKEGGMHIQLCLDEPEAFNNFMAHYGSFKNVNNYIAIVGKRNGSCYACTYSNEPTKISFYLR